MKKIMLVLGLLTLLLALASTIVWADPPTPPGEPPRAKPTDVPRKGMPEADVDKEKDKDTDKDKDQGGKRNGIFGIVDSKTANTFTVVTKQGNVVVTGDDKTRFHIPTKKSATLNDVNKDDRVSVNGTWSGTTFTAKQVQITPGKPSTQHRVGIVQAYTPNSSITIVDTKGETATFKVTQDTEIRKTSGTLAVGDRVTVVASRDPSTDVFTARAIVVQSK